MPSSNDENAYQQDRQQSLLLHQLHQLSDLLMSGRPSAAVGGSAAPAWNGTGVAARNQARDDALLASNQASSAQQPFLPQRLLNDVQRERVAAAVSDSALPLGEASRSMGPSASNSLIQSLLQQQNTTNHPSITDQLLSSLTTGAGGISSLSTASLLNGGLPSAAPPSTSGGGATIEQLLALRRRSELLLELNALDQAIYTMAASRSTNGSDTSTTGSALPASVPAPSGLQLGAGASRSESGLVVASGGGVIGRRHSLASVTGRDAPPPTATGSSFSRRCLSGCAQQRPAGEGVSASISSAAASLAQLSQQQANRSLAPQLQQDQGQGTANNSAKTYGKRSSSDSSLGKRRTAGIFNVLRQVGAVSSVRMTAGSSWYPTEATPNMHRRDSSDDEAQRPRKGLKRAAEASPEDKQQQPPAQPVYSKSAAAAGGTASSGSRSKSSVPVRVVCFGGTSEQRHSAMNNGSDTGTGSDGYRQDTTSGSGSGSGSGSSEEDDGGPKGDAPRARRKQHQGRSLGSGSNNGSDAATGDGTPSTLTPPGNRGSSKASSSKSNMNSNSNSGSSEEMPQQPRIPPPKPIFLPILQERYSCPLHVALQRREPNLQEIQKILQTDPGAMTRRDGRLQETALAVYLKTPRPNTAAAQDSIRTTSTTASSTNVNNTGSSGSSTSKHSQKSKHSGGSKKSRESGSSKKGHEKRAGYIHHSKLATKKNTESDVDANKDKTSADKAAAKPMNFNWIGKSSARLVDYLLSLSPAAAGMTDRQGNTPLHIASSYGVVNLHIIQRLTMVYPEALHMRNMHGKTPLRLCQERTVLFSSALAKKQQQHNQRLQQQQERQQQQSQQPQQGEPQKGTAQSQRPISDAGSRNSSSSGVSEDHSVRVIEFLHKATYQRTGQ